jgi:hypothetical protein
MLIRFSIENFLSFNERQTFSMLPGKGSLKPHHKSEPIKGVSVLKTALVFGANAAGKSNLVKSIAFGKDRILKGTPADLWISQDFFKLDPDGSEKPAFFEYEIQHKGKNYAYGFRFNYQEIQEEWLYELSKKGQKKLFERSAAVEFDLRGLFRNTPSKAEHQFLQFTAKSTPRNQLFLHHIRNQNLRDNLSNVTPLLDVLDWFQNALSVVFPGSKDWIKTYEILENKDLKELFASFLDYCHTGIDGVEFETLSADKSGLSEETLQEAKSHLQATSSEKRIAFIHHPATERYFILDLDDHKQLKVRVLRTKHKLPGGGHVLFDIKDESDGTRRIIDLIPLIVDFLQGGNVFVVDEIERSLHPNLVREIFDFLLDHCHGVNSQIIATTHESTLLTQKLIRKDEIWFATKSSAGATHLHSLEDFSVRFDKDIMKDYLLGRYRGIPNLGDRIRVEQFVQ